MCRCLFLPSLLFRGGEKGEGARDCILHTSGQSGSTVCGEWCHFMESGEESLGHDCDVGACIGSMISSI